jgi:hypothetical protein
MEDRRRWLQLVSNEKELSFFAWAELASSAASRLLVRRFNVRRMRVASFFPRSVRLPVIRNS